MTPKVFQPARSDISRSRRAAAGGFTLIEALIGTAILSMSVLALSSAMGAGQKTSIEGQKTTLSAMIISDALSELSTTPYQSLNSYHGRYDPPGQLKALDGGAYPQTYWMLGRAFSVTDQTVTEPGLGVTIKGKRVLVFTHDGSRVVASAERFVPEPGS